LERASKVIKSMGRYIQCIGTGSDLGTQTAPMVNPVIYEELVAPYLKKFCSFIHENSDCKVFMHCCGSIKPFIPILTDCGIDILNPVQISAKNMDPNDLKDNYGNEMTYWGGGCDTQNILNVGSPEDVKENVRNLIKIFKPGTGFVFNQVHNIMGDITPENIVTMFDTAYEESFY
jgi:uroporphyrinogen decarboxylase